MVGLVFGGVVGLGECLLLGMRRDRRLGIRLGDRWVGVGGRGMR